MASERWKGSPILTPIQKKPLSSHRLTESCNFAVGHKPRTSLNLANSQDFYLKIVSTFIKNNSENNKSPQTIKQMQLSTPRQLSPKNTAHSPLRKSASIIGKKFELASIQE